MGNMHFHEIVKFLKILSCKYFHAYKIYIKLCTASEMKAPRCKTLGAIVHFTIKLPKLADLYRYLCN